MNFTGEQLKEMWEWALRTSHPAACSKGCICHRMICIASPEHPHWRAENKHYTDSIWAGMEGYVAWNQKCPVHGTPVFSNHPDGPPASVWYEAWWKKMHEDQQEKTA